MKGKIVILDQDRNLWVPVFDKPYELVGHFLKSAVGRGVELCEEYYLRGAEAIASGKCKPYDTGGNGIEVRITPTWVLIEDAYHEEEQGLMISMSAYQSVLKYWSSILKTCEKTCPTPPPIDPPEFRFDDPTVPGLTLEMAEAEFWQLRADLCDLPVFEYCPDIEGKS